VSLVSNIMPGAQTIEIFGLIIQFLGEGFICYGIVNAISNRVAAGDELSRQVLFAGVSRNMQEQVAGVSRNMEEQIARVNAKLDQIQQAKASQRLPPMPAD
jgi:hypothetical protein